MTAVDALQDTLAAEHAALYLYGVLGGRTSRSATPDLYALLERGYDVHRAQRDQLVRTLRDLGVEPVPAAVTYDLAGPVDNQGQVRQAVAGLEDRCTATYAWLVAETVGDQRRWAVTALIAGALRLTALGLVPVEFPGAPDLG